MGISQQIGASSLSKPGVCTSSTRPATPYEGQMIYETDTDKVLVWNGSAWLYSATPQTLEIGAWQSYTPTFVNITVGNGTVVARYSQINKVVTVQMKFTLGSTSTIAVAGAITMSLPVTSATAQYASSSLIGIGSALDTGITNYQLWTLWVSSTTVGFGYMTSNRYQEIYSVGPFTWATNDVLACSFTYEAA